MTLLKKLLVVIAATGVMESAQAQIPNPDLGILSPAAKTETGFRTSGSFADIFNFSIGADYHGFLGTAVGLAKDGTEKIGAISNLTLTLFAGSDATGPIRGSVTSSDGSLINLSGALLQGNYSARISGLIADSTLGGGYQFVASANPEPAEWMLLLAGLVVVGFMARRRASSVVG